MPSIKQYIDHLKDFPDGNAEWKAFIAQYENNNSEELNDLIDFTIALGSFTWNERAAQESRDILEKLKNNNDLDKDQKLQLIKDMIEHEIAQLAMANFLNARANLGMVVGPEYQRIMANTSATAREKQSALEKLFIAQKNLFLYARVIAANDKLSNDTQEQTQQEIGKARDFIEKLPIVMRNNLIKLAKAAWESIHNLSEDISQDLLMQSLNDLRAEGGEDKAENIKIEARQKTKSAFNEISDRFFPYESPYLSPLDQKGSKPYLKEGDISSIFIDLKDFIAQMDFLYLPTGSKDIKAQYLNLLRNSILREFDLLSEAYILNLRAQNDLIFTPKDLEEQKASLNKKIDTKLTNIEDDVVVAQNDVAMEDDFDEEAFLNDIVSEVSQKEKADPLLDEMLDGLLDEVEEGEQNDFEEYAEPLSPPPTELKSPKLDRMANAKRRIDNLAKHFIPSGLKQPRSPSPTLGSVDESVGAMTLPSDGANLLDYLRHAFNPKNAANYFIQVDKRSKKEHIFKRKESGVKKAKDKLVCKVKQPKAVAPDAVTIEFDVARTSMPYYESIKPLLIAAKMKAESENKPLSNFMLDLPDLKTAEHAQQLFLAIYDVFRPTIEELNKVGEGVDIFENIVRIKPNDNIRKAFNDFCAPDYEQKFISSLKDLFVSDNLNDVVRDVTAGRRLFVTHAEETILKDYTPPTNRSSFRLSKL